MLYRRRAEIPEDYSEAFRWFHAAAEQHHPAAADNLGNMYLNGKGVAQDYLPAARWYAIGAAEDYAPAQNNLAQL